MTKKKSEILYKKCAWCNLDFTTTKKCQKYCQSHCQILKTNSREYQAFLYKKHIQRPGDRERRAISERKHYAKLKDYMREYKIKKGCVVCGYKRHHAALQFDHIFGKKTNNVSNIKSLEKMKEEIKKCEVVCSNCHDIRTYDRIQENLPQNSVANDCKGFM